MELMIPSFMVFRLCMVKDWAMRSRVTQPGSAAKGTCRLRIRKMSLVLQPLIHHKREDLFKTKRHSSRKIR
jgi:hypothetical protein